MEIPFAFNNLDKPGVAEFIGEGGDPQKVADTMHAVWTQFVRGEALGWPTYDLNARTSMIFNEESGAVADVDSGVRDAWAGIR